MRFATLSRPNCYQYSFLTVHASRISLDVIHHPLSATYKTGTTAAPPVPRIRFGTRGTHNNSVAPPVHIFKKKTRLRFYAFSILSSSCLTALARKLQRTTWALSALLPFGM
jgi:hypothetical protein